MREKFLFLVCAFILIASLVFADDIYNGYSGVFPDYLKKSNQDVFSNKFSISHSYTMSYSSSNALGNNVSGMYLAHMKYQFNPNWALKADVGFVQTKFFSQPQNGYDFKENSNFNFDNIVIPNIELNYISPNKKFRFSTGFSYYGSQALYSTYPYWYR